MYYRGRFAPSPTGALHTGSLVTALASWLEARTHNGQWLLRIEDLDPPREDPTASVLIPKQLEAHGLVWDGPIRYQSQHSADYEAALAQLAPHIFPCDCSRKTLTASHGLHINPCTPHSQPCALRLRVPDSETAFNDACVGHYAHNLKYTAGDFILKRKEGLYAYQLAVVVDDELQGISHIVRGSDLLDNTPRQIYLQQCLGFNTPHYAHLPLVLNADGQKLSKQNLAPPLNLDTCLQNLCFAGQFLGLPPHKPDDFAHIADFLKFALQHWQLPRWQFTA